jgi:hypothetical protein
VGQVASRDIVEVGVGSWPPEERTVHESRKKGDGHMRLGVGVGNEPVEAAEVGMLVAGNMGFRD